MLALVQGDIVLLNKFLLLSLVTTTLVLTGCASPQQYDWVKEGVSSHEKESVLSECKYNILLNKTELSQQQELLGLCMQGQGFRYKPVS